MNNTKIRLKDLTTFIISKGYKETDDVYIKETKSGITIRLNNVYSHYQPVAKCGKYSGAHCMHDWRDCEDCIKCTLVKRHAQLLYKFIDGHKYKKCPRCGEYHPIEHFALNKMRQYSSWCDDCKKEYRRTYNRQQNKSV